MFLLIVTYLINCYISCSGLSTNPHYLRPGYRILGHRIPGYNRVFELQWDYMLIFLPKKHNKSNISANSCLIEDFTCKLYSLTLIGIVEWLFGGIKPFADKDDLINLLWKILK